MKITVTPKVVSGTRRGGEDLKLVVVGVAKGSEPPTSFDGFEVLFKLDNPDAYSAQLVGDENTPEEDEDEDEEEREDYEGLLTDQNQKVRLLTDFYEVEWTGSLKDVLARLGQPDWEFRYKPGQPAKVGFKQVLYLDGNAD